MSAGPADRAAVARVESIAATEGMRPTVVRAQEPGVESLVRLFAYPGIAQGEATVGVWRGDVGTYLSPGAANGEIYVVHEGTARLEIEGQPVMDIGPGAIVVLPPRLKSTFTVTQPLTKFWVKVEPGV